MKAERLFRILGLIDDDLVEEATPSLSAARQRKQRLWMPMLAAAACLAVINAPLPLGASTTSTPQLRPLMIRFRFGKFHL